MKLKMLKKQVSKGLTKLISEITKLLNVSGHSNTASPRSNEVLKQKHV